MTTAQVALVTGAARGIGLASARALLAQGHRVVMVDLGAMEAAALVDRAHLAQTRCETADVADAGQMRELKERVHGQVGPVSILVNNAGISPKKADGSSSGILDVSLDEWRRVLDVNLTSIMRLCQMFLPAMKAQGYGRIVNVSSLAGRSKSVVAGPSYMASKAGVLGLTRAIAAEMGPFGITANCVAPGRVLTEMAQQAGPEVNRRYAEQIPVRRLGTPDEVGAAIAFLCAESSGFINGAVIDINGGFYMP